MGAVRHNRHTRAQVLAHFAESGRIDLATAAAGVARDCHYDWLVKYPDYAADYEKAREKAVDMLECEGWRRAKEGVAEPVFHAGKRAVDFVIGEDGKPVQGTDGKPIARPAIVRKYSDQLLMFLLKGRRRDVYGDKLEATGKDGKQLFPVDALRSYMQAQPDDAE